jgi:hypothetical protein
MLGRETGFEKVSDRVCSQEGSMAARGKTCQELMKSPGSAPSILDAFLQIRFSCHLYPTRLICGSRKPYSRRWWSWNSA